MPATVKLRVSREVVGRILHLLEYHVEVTLLSRSRPNACGVEEWAVRTDLPEHWEGRLVTLRIERCGHFSWVLA